MPLMIFYTDYSTDQHVESEEERPAGSIKDITAKMEEILAEEENFIGLFDDKGNTVQFMSLGDDGILLDIPVVSRNGSFNKDISIDEAIRIVQRLNDPIDTGFISGLRFETWEDQEDVMLDD